MRRIVFDTEAERELSNQLDYLISHHAINAAHDLVERARLFLVNHLARLPATGRRLDYRGLWECWIPRTKLVLWYRFTDTELQIVHVWHASQDRDASE